MFDGLSDKLINFEHFDSFFVFFYLKSEKIAYIFRNILIPGKHIRLFYLIFMTRNVRKWISTHSGQLVGDEAVVPEGGGWGVVEEGQLYDLIASKEYRGASFRAYSYRNCTVISVYLLLRIEGSHCGLQYSQPPSSTGLSS